MPALMGHLVLKFVTPKGGKGRTIRLPTRTVEALKAHRARQAEEELKAGPLYQDGGFVFATEVGTPLEPSNVETGAASSRY